MKQVIYVHSNNFASMFIVVAIFVFVRYREIVRKKAVLCMHSFHCKAPDLLRHAQHHFKSALCDKDPGVMWASLHVFYDLVQVLLLSVILIASHLKSIDKLMK